MSNQAATIGRKALSIQESIQEIVYQTSLGYLTPERLKAIDVYVKDIESDLQELTAVLPTALSVQKAQVTLFRASGKYYTDEEWEIPTQDNADSWKEGEDGTWPTGGDWVIPYIMKYSKDFRRISDGGKVLVVTQEPWGYPHLI